MRYIESLPPSLKTVKLRYVEMILYVCLTLNGDGKSRLVGIVWVCCD